MWNYTVINSGPAYQDYLAHSAKGSTWKNHKYIRKETKNGKVRYYYADENGNDTGDDVNTDMVPGEYELDAGDQEYIENHRNGTDTRTFDEYQRDKSRAIAAANAEEKERIAAEQKRKEEEEEKKKPKTNSSSKKSLKQRARTAAKYAIIDAVVNG